MQNLLLEIPHEKEPWGQCIFWRLHLWCSFEVEANGSCRSFRNVWTKTLAGFQHGRLKGFFSENDRCLVCNSLRKSLVASRGPCLNNASTQLRHCPWSSGFTADGWSARLVFQTVWTRGAANTANPAEFESAHCKASTIPTKTERMSPAQWKNCTTKDIENQIPFEREWLCSVLGMTKWRCLSQVVNFVFRPRCFRQWWGDQSCDFVPYLSVFLHT